MAKKKIIKIEEPVELKKAPLLRNNVPDPIPSVLSGLLRFSPDHIVRLIYDPDSKAYRLGDLSQNLVSEGTMGESGGGSLNNPILTINCHAASAGAAYYVNKIVDGTMTVTPEYVDANETKDVETVVFYSADYNAYRYYAEDGMPNTVASDEVNCTYSGGDVIITDPTLPASITLTGSDDNNGDD